MGANSIRSDIAAAQRDDRFNGFHVTNKKHRIELAVVGYGNWGSKHVRVLAAMPDVAITVVDRDPLRLAEAGRAFPMVHLDESLDHVLPTVDGVIIATPPGSHAAIAHAAMRAECHVLVEKPLATSVSDCESLIDAAILNGVQLMVGHTFEHDAAIWKLRDIANSGELGEIRYIDCARLNLGLFQQDVNVIWDLAPHDVSIINFILGRPPTAVSAWGHSHANRGLEDVAHIQLRYAETGVRAYIHVSWLDPCKVRRVTIVGSDKMVVYNDLAGDQKIRIYDVGIEAGDDPDPRFGQPVKYRIGDIFSPRVTPQEPLAVQAAHLIDCMRTGAVPRTDGHNGLAVARVLEAANTALRSGSEVLLASPPVLDIAIDPVALYPPVSAAAILDSQATG
ncbi:MAG TPA: Gfo/Idh/MocA family oxidoreductase [Acidimicrobiia bacterium]|nr:Gfo/Idh/MocA family oxidoreductase [Acidimicrobiia bacterium]